MKRTLGLVSLAAIISTAAFAEDSAPAATTTPATSSDTAAVTAPAQPAAVIDCNYVISSDTKQIDPAIITQWAEKATIQSFDYDFNSIDGQLDKLKVCFTDEGWTGFNDALKKSGNVEAIKSQHLAVSAMATGKTEMQTIKENQWKLTIPVQVVYQNSEEKLTQKLNIDVLVGRKPSGNLGILQMIATPEKTAAVNPTPDAAPTNTNAPAVTATPDATTPAANTTTPTTTNTTETPQTATPTTTPSITTPEIPATNATTPATTTPTTTPETATTPQAPAATTTPQTNNTQQ